MSTSQEGDQYASIQNLQYRIEKSIATSSDNSKTNYERIFELMLPHLQDKTEILELGAGLGHLWTQNIHRMPSHWHVLATDKSEAMVSHLCSQLPSCPNSFDVKVLDAEQFELSTKVDAIICLFAVYHMDPLKFFNSAKQALNPNGIIVIATIGNDHNCEINDLLCHHNVMKTRHPISDQVIAPGLRPLLQDQFTVIDEYDWKSQSKFATKIEVVDYMKSFWFTKQVTDWSPIEESVDERFKLEQGYFPVTKHQAVYFCIPK